MHREIFRLALPNVISNITVPLLGMADMAIAGRFGGNSAAAIGALSIGTTIFNFIYWNFGFLRMGTSGLTAQAWGAGDEKECADMFVRSLSLAVAVSALMLLLQRPIGHAAIYIMHGDGAVAEYFFARIWAVPAAISLFALNGWYIGMQNAVVPMVVAIVQNIINVAFSLWFAVGLNMGLAGVAWGTVVAQWSGVLIFGVWSALRYGRILARADWSHSFSPRPMMKFFAVNRDIFLRSACLVLAYSFFTAASARFDSALLLAVNALLMQLFTLFSYVCDGVAYAAEALTGRFIGARDGVSLRRFLRAVAVWGAGVALCYVAAYLAGWRWILGLFTDGDPALLDVAARYVGWVIVVPLAGAPSFLLDGIMVGATHSRVMRNSVFWATALYFAIYFSLRGLLGNDALWLAFTLFLVVRGVLEYYMAGGVKNLASLLAK